MGRRWRRMGLREERAGVLIPGGARNRGGIDCWMIRISRDHGL